MHRIFTSMKHSNIPCAQSVVQYCKARDIQNIVISPGSRNAPLIIGFSEDPFFKCFSIVDERCAAFFALGIAQQLMTPVALVCTSGSALLNYYPAISEAFYSNIPLVVLSADRPTYKIDVGDGQTIRQDNVFENHIGYSASLRQDVVHATDRIRKYRPDWLSTDSMETVQMGVQKYNEITLNTAISIAWRSKRPVHINIPFEEPLYGTTTQTPLIALQDDKVEVAARSDQDLKKFVKIWNGSARKMILVGVNRPDEVAQSYLDQLAKDPSVIVLTETTSNLHHPNFFPSIDSLIAPIEKSDHKEALFQKLQPEVLLTFGGMIVSKKIKAFLRAYQPKHHWHVDEQGAFDTFFCLSHHFNLRANEFFQDFLAEVSFPESDYYSYWQGIKMTMEAKRETYLKKILFSDMKAFQIGLASIPPKYQLQLANSSTVRYAQLFDLDNSLDVFCNRGSSGIDGSTSTAIGASLYHKSPTVLMTGDLGFFYDSNALWNNYIRRDFRIILVNNKGGGIFRILPGSEDSGNFETYFETTHRLTARALCEMYGFQYLQVNSMKKMQKAFKTFYDDGDRPKLIEIMTPRILNDKILFTYFDFISSGIINH